MSKLSIAVTKHDHIQGNPDAACSLVEYGDYECPACGEVQTIIKRLQAHFGSQMSFVFRNFPLREIHPWAQPAAEVAEFAGSRGRFWEMHDLLFENQESLDDGLFEALILKLDLSGSDLKRARSSDMTKKRIDADFAGGIRSGVNGTPSFFLNGERYDGPTDQESLAALMEQVLISDGD
ncbi:DsbA family protein [Acidipila sp. EB88]|uniref:DsbA family protein n=1 Tax=Acidipila sp. EB88 TaxID=2305226 RepID=UPI000F5ECC81|nr:DsbA family protein [Acidipila sp. EB88]RRA47661.1 DsbA family protein [Acidipila sp. EB88]